MDGEQKHEPQTASEPEMSAASTEPHTDADKTPQSSIKDDYKVFGVLGYLIPFLFFLPMLQEKMKDDPYVRFHMNQQLILLATAVIAWAIGDYLLIMLLGMLGFVLARLIQIGILVLAIIGILNVVKGEQKELPIIGGFTLLP